MIPKDDETKLKIKKSLSISWKEGIPAALMQGVMDYYLIPFGLFLGASPHQIGILVALPHLLGSVTQLFAVRAVNFSGSRLRFLVQMVFLQAIFLIPISLLAVILLPQRIWLLVFLAMLFRVFANLIQTAWGSLISDYLAPNQRGNYLGWRSQVTGFAGLLGVGFGGLLLYLMRDYPAAGFFFLFLFAFLCRFFSYRFMGQMVDLPLSQGAESQFTFVMFLKRFRESNFVKYVLYVAAVAFAANISSPYVSVYILQDLHYDYFRYMIIHLSAVIAGLIAFPIWGRHADLVGNAKILKITSFLIPVIPFLWIVSNNFYYLIAAQIFSGFVWGGFNLCTVNFIFDAVTPEKRVRCLGYFTLINGIGIFAGTYFGGWVVEYLVPFKGSAFLTLFMISGVLRFASHFLLSSGFKEVRESTEKVSSMKLFFSVVGIETILPAEAESSFQPGWKISSFFKQWRRFLKP